MALIKCNECGKEISSQAKSCPNCGAPTENLINKKSFNKKIIFGTSGIIISIIIIFLGIYLVKVNQKSYIYGNEIIEVLNSLKRNEISEDNAYNQLEEIDELVKKEYSKIDSSSNEYHRLFMISLAISGVQRNILDFREDITISEINEAINEIKEQISLFNF